jgi:hypothetical protein
MTRLLLQINILQIDQYRSLMIIIEYQSIKSKHSFQASPPWPVMLRNEASAGLATAIAAA